MPAKRWQCHDLPMPARSPPRALAVAHHLRTPAPETCKSPVHTAWGILAGMDRKQRMPPCSGDAASDTPQRQADERERHADNRERKADDREILADERDRQADERERQADERERKADERERKA